MELPEVENIIRTLPPDLIGRQVVGAEVCFPDRICCLSSHSLRRRILDARIAGFGRRGKYVLLHFDTERTLIWHLGMSGRVAVDHGSAPVKYLLMAVELDDGRFVKLYDARRFGRIGLSGTNRLETYSFFEKMGREYDDPELTPELLVQRAERFRKRSVKEALLDQGFIAGIGNIYSDETFWQAKIHPFKDVSKLTDEELKEIYQAMKEILAKAIKLGGESISDFRRISGEKGYFDKERKVYRREGKPCPSCGTKIKRTKLGGRSAHYCPNCQIC